MTAGEIDAKLKGVLSRYEELTALAADPDVLADHERYMTCCKELADLEEVAAAIQELAENLTAQAETASIEEEAASDPELRRMIYDELGELTERETELRERIRILMLPSDPRDKRNVIIEIRAGAGGEEAALFAAELYNMYTLYAAEHNFRVELIDVNETDLGGYKQIVFALAGQKVFSRLKFESGVHRVQRVPETESGGRIHTSTVTVAVMPEVDEVEVEIRPEDLQIDTYHASGAGGQHVNKTSSAIRITHLPTGTVVTCQDQRSQFQNKERALAVLRAILLDQKEAARAGSIADERRSQIGTGDRSERIRTYNYPQSRVTDHRIGLTLYRLDDVLAGHLDLLIEPLMQYHQAQLLEKGQG